jgi:hypothetical protein
MARGPGRPRVFRPISNRNAGGLEIATTYIPDADIFALVGRAQRNAIKANAIQIRKLAQRLMSKGVQRAAHRAANPVKRAANGRFTSSGTSTSGGSTGRSKSGELPRTQTGNYRSSIQYKFFSNKKGAFVGPSWPKGAHAGMLKYGTKRMGARLVPSVVALEKFQSRIMDSYKDKL